jgi:hypothetical protein
MAKDNEAKIKNYLILSEIAKQEKIEATEDEVAAAVKKAVENNEEGGPISEEEAANEQVKAYYRDTLKTEKVFEFLESQFKK